MQSIELLFDDETDQALRASWAVLADAGLPSLATHTGESNRPHVTVAVTDTSEEAPEGFRPALDGVRAACEGWSLGSTGLAAAVGAPLLFGGHRNRWVLVRQLVPSRPLLTLHAAVHRALREHAPDAPVSEQTQPDGWTPHVSLTRRIDGDRLEEALRALPLEPLPGRLRGARLWDSITRTVTPVA